MAWSIAAVARMSGVTSRTLRHYDDIGLLAPAFVGPNRYRYYELAQLLRLQQILVLRELGLGLGEIGPVLAAEPDLVAALRRHHQRLLAEQHRLARLAATVARTLTELESGGHEMTMPQINRPENLFEGFDASAHDAEARSRWPEEYEHAQEVAARFTPSQMQSEHRDMTAHIIRMAELMVAARSPDDAAVLDEVDWHFRHVSRFWTPSAGAYAALGQMYVDDGRFGDNYERVAVGLAAYVRDAMAAYAGARLA
jgi:MerR family transcriptional regulator, thiopeptide resistance regulator